MTQYITKRDGSKEELNPQKIIRAIDKAGSVKSEVVQKIVESVEKNFHDGLSVEEIQDLVELGLMR